MAGDRLFYPAPALPGILKCKCGELFVTGAYLRLLMKELKAEHALTNWLPTPEAEIERRRAHAQYHVKRGEATYAPDGYFRMRVEPVPTTARDSGFTR